MSAARTIPAPAPTRLAGIPVRDHAVDLIKGWACLLMLVAHVPFPHAAWLETATMGAVLFFTSTGMNFQGLVERGRGDELRIAGNALFLIFAGFADNYVLGTLGQADVFQSAGMAMLAMLLLRALLPRWWTWLFPLPFAIHYANAHVFYWKIHAGGLSSFFLAPGLFPLLPWLSFYLLGAHLKHYPTRRMRLGLAAAFLAALGLAAARSGFHFDKFWMSTDYWLLGLAYAALLLEGLRTWLARHPHPPLAELRLWGGNSLVYYLLLGLVLRLGELRWPDGFTLALVALIGTAALLRPALALQAWVRRQPPWPVLAGCAALAGLVLALEAGWLQSYIARSFIAFGLTLAFLAAYPAWKRVTAAWPRRGGAARAAWTGAQGL